jgi:hypothetical protein
LGELPCSFGLGKLSSILLHYQELQAYAGTFFILMKSGAFIFDSRLWCASRESEHWAALEQVTIFLVSNAL